MVTEFIFIIRWTNLILVSLATGLWICAYIKYKEPGFIAILTWLIDLLAFYIFRFMAIGHQTQAIINLINLWSSIIFLHGTILVLGIWWLWHLRKCYLKK